MGLRPLVHWHLVSDRSQPDSRMPVAKQVIWRWRFVNYTLETADERCAKLWVHVLGHKM